MGILQPSLVVFGLGMAAGYYAHKYRKEIIRSASSITGKDKDSVLRKRKTWKTLLQSARNALTTKPPEARRKVKHKT